MNTSQGDKALRMLLVDDDAELGGMLTEYFSALGHQLDLAYNGRDGLVRALQNHYHVVLLDVMLPTINGFSVLRRLRQRQQVPVIVLTARNRREDVIAGLDGGADDYVAKPFDPDELLARIRSIVRRAHASADRLASIRAFNALTIDVSSRQVRSGNRRVELTGLEFEILERLTRVAGRVVVREELIESVLNRSANPFDRALDVHISHLRAKLADSGVLIRTVRGVGYVFTHQTDIEP
jgi:two-component system response regulator CpxR